MRKRMQWNASIKNISLAITLPAAAAGAAAAAAADKILFEEYKSNMAQTQPNKCVYWFFVT